MTIDNMMATKILISLFNSISNKRNKEQNIIYQQKEYILQVIQEIAKKVPLKRYLHLL